MGTQRIERMRSVVLKVTGYFIPLVQSLPAWSGLMTLPFASYLIMLFTNLSVNLPRALADFFQPMLIFEKSFVIIGLVILISSIIFLTIKKKDGLVTSGPYGLVRHPQYLGMILSTLGFTSWSLWILNNTFGIGFLSPTQTIGVWFIELFAYFLLAYIEELDLFRRYRASFQNYQGQVPFLIPFLKTNSTLIDVLLTLLILASLLFGLSLLPALL